MALLAPKQHHEASVFNASNLLREARRQRGLAEVATPAVCILDPDGDLHRHLHATGSATADEYWACYHTTLSRCTIAGREVGILPFTVGAPFAVLVAEELAASGCKLVINLTSAGRIAAPRGVAAFVVIERALRDEGTSLHYLPASPWSCLRADMRQRLANLTAPGGPPILYGSTWTTDAPFRETEADVARHRDAGILGVEMEAAALYAYAEATGKPCSASHTSPTSSAARATSRRAHPTVPRTHSESSRPCSAASTDGAAPGESAARHFY